MSKLDRAIKRLATRAGLRGPQRFGRALHRARRKMQDRTKVALR
jgi:hypothetical protein